MLAVILTLLVGGSVGFHLLEGWDWLDSLYTTVVTLFTVGYGDFTPETSAGKIFAMALILGGLGVISYAAVELTAFVVEGHLNRILRLRKVDNMVKKVSGHYIVCGAGKTGMHIISELVKNKVPFVVIDRDVNKMDDPRRPQATPTSPATPPTTRCCNGPASRRPRPWPPPWRRTRPTSSCC